MKIKTIVSYMSVQTHMLLILFISDSIFKFSDHKSTKCLNYSCSAVVELKYDANKNSKIINYDTEIE